MTSCIVSLPLLSYCRGDFQNFDTLDMYEQPLAPWLRAFPGIAEAAVICEAHGGFWKKLWPSSVLFSALSYPVNLERQPQYRVQAYVHRLSRSTATTSAGSKPFFWHSSGGPSPLTHAAQRSVRAERGFSGRLPLRCSPNTCDKLPKAAPMCLWPPSTPVPKCLGGSMPVCCSR